MKTKKEIEKGIWIVYNLEANREIQNLLMKKKFVFRFEPSLKIIEKKAIQKALEDEIEFLKNINTSLLIPFKEGMKIVKRIKELTQKLNKEKKK